MGKRSEQAVLYHSRGYNCAQAVACAFADVIDMDEKDIFRLSEGFGLGMGARETCGAVSGMLMVASALSSDANTEAPATKQKTYKLMRELQDAFREKNSSTICRELLGGQGKPKLRSCPGCVEDAAELLEQMLNDKNIAVSGKKEEKD